MDLDAELMRIKKRLDELEAFRAEVEAIMAEPYYVDSSAPVAGGGPVETVAEDNGGNQGG